MVNVIMGDLVDADESLMRRSIRSVRRRLTVRRRRNPLDLKVRYFLNKASEMIAGPLNPAQCTVRTVSVFPPSLSGGYTIS